MNVRDVGEFPFIDRIAKDTIYTPSSVRTAIGDDGAVYIPVAQMDQVVTVDTMVEGIHFNLHWMSPKDVGFRLMTANVSDIAAMGAKPTQAVISVAASGSVEVEVLEEIYKGMKACARAYGVNIIGGDTVATEGPLVLTVTVIGEVPAEKAVLRSGAKEGDFVGVTGILGLSAVGMQTLSQGVEGYESAKEVFLRPLPKVRLGTILREEGAHSLNDISDGLASEANEIAKASGKALYIVEKDIPLCEDLVRWGKIQSVHPTQYAYTGGEDFELLFTISKERWASLEARLELEGLAGAITCIGRVEAGEGKAYVERDGKKVELPAKGYQHFHPLEE